MNELDVERGEASGQVHIHPGVRPDDRAEMLVEHVDCAVTEVSSVEEAVTAGVGGDGEAGVRGSRGGIVSHDHGMIWIDDIAPSGKSAIFCHKQKPGRR